MRWATSLSILAGLALSGAGQVADGDLLLVVGGPPSGFVARVDRASGAWTTLVPPLVAGSPRWLRMAPDNRRLLAGYFDPWANPLTTALVSVTPGSTFMPMVAVPHAILEEFELDHDDRWAIVSSVRGQSVLLAFEHSTGRVTTFFQAAAAAGDASAQVVLPPGLRAGLGIPVFVAGVIHDAAGVRTLTNTHWFVLN